MNAKVESSKPVTRFGITQESKNISVSDNKLQSEISITLHTRLALRVWQGRKKTADKPAIVSYPRFADITRLIEQSVRNDDPYADYYFYELHNSIVGAREKMQTMRKAVEQTISENLPDGVSMTSSLSQAPEVIELRIASKLAFIAMYLLADFDFFVRQVMLARHTALVERDVAERFLYQGQKIVRSVLHSTSKWRFTGVTRDDLAANNQTAQRAIELMGELEHEFLKAEKRSPFAPPITRHSKLDQVSPAPEGVDSEDALDAALDALEEQDSKETVEA